MLRGIIKKVLFLSIIVLLLTGCGKSGKNRNEIEFLTNRTEFVRGNTTSDGSFDESTAYYKILADKFEKETGIKVKLTAYTDYQNSMLRRLSSNDPGDVITINDPAVFTQKSITTFFQPLGTKEELSNYLFLNDMAVGENVYGLAPAYNLSGAIYNKKVFAEAGYKEFPKNLTELHDAFAKIKKNGKIPVITNRGSNWSLAQLGLYVSNFAGNPDIINKLWSERSPFGNDKPMGELFNELALWVSKGWVEPEFINDFEGSRVKIASGEAGVTFLGSWVYPQIQRCTESIKGAEKDDIGFAAFPICNPYQSKQYIFAAGENRMAITKNTENYEACKKWINYIIDSDISMGQGGLPIKKDVDSYDPAFNNVMEEIKDDKVIRIDQLPPNDFNGLRTIEILKDIDLFADNKYIGKALDEARKSMQSYQDYINRLNEQFDDTRKSRGY